MDANEATRMVFSRIQALDPQNASKIMGLLLLHDLPQRDMIRLALAPHSLLHSFILQAHTHLSLSSSSSNNDNNSISVPISSSSFSSSTLSNLQKLDQTHNNTDFLDETHLHNSDFFNPQPLEPAKMVGQHRRSLSFSDAFLGSSSSDPSLGWKPCLYYARGFCKNGSNCRFLHDSSDPTPIEHYQEQELQLLRSKSLQHQRLNANNASQLFASGSPPYSAESLNFMLHQQHNDSQRGAARIEMNDFFMNPGVGMVNPASRQIYLTFPADSTFREEDVSNYFGIYGPVQDVRIPYQQKRMFGFVTFVFPDTVKLILSKGNPHFIADARVLVKPYKEKGKIPDKYKQQPHPQPQPERGDFSLCDSTLNGLDSRDTHDLQFGNPRLLYGNQDLILRRKLEEETNLQRTIELQSQRLMALQLLDVKKKHYYHHHHRNLSAGAVPFSSQSYSNAMVNQSLILPMSSLPNQSSLKENFRSPSSTTISKRQAEFNGNLESPKIGDSNFHDSVEHNLPDSLFASPTKSGGDPSSFSTAAAEDEQCVAASSSTCSSSTSSNNNNLMPTTSTLDMDSFESRFFQMPRFSTGHGAIEM